MKRVALFENLIWRWDGMFGKIDTNIENGDKRNKIFYQ